MSLGILLFLYYMAITASISYYIGKTCNRFLLNNSADSWTIMLIGFTLAPVIFSWLGYSRIASIDYFSELIGIIAFVYAILFLISNRVKLINSLQQNWPVVLPIFIAVILLFSCKICYLEGAINNHDDLRSVALTGSIAANNLKPAFVTDFSIPLSYSYYLYEWSAFLYASVNGIGMPSVPVLASNLYAVAFFYIILLLMGKMVFKDFGRHWYWLLIALITFYGFDFTYQTVWERKHLEWWNGKQITQMASYFHWTNQYLFSAGLSLLAFSNLIRFFELKNRNNGLLFILFHASAAGFGAITFTWSTLAILTILPMFFLRNWSINTFTLILKQFLPALLLTLFILLPLLPTFVGREVIVGFHLLPEWWFSEKTHNHVNSLFNHLIILNNEIGPILIVGLIILLFFGKLLPPRNNQAALYFSAYGISLFLISIFSSSIYFDWFSRGVLLLVIISAIYSSGLIWQFQKTFKPLLVYIPLVVLLAPQAFNFLLENEFRRQQCLADKQIQDARNINRSFPSGTLFYSTDKYLLNTLLLSGRPVTTDSNQDILSTYRNKDEFLSEKLKWKKNHDVCFESAFGKTVENNTYVDAQLVNFTIKTCDDK